MPQQSETRWTSDHRNLFGSNPSLSTECAFHCCCCFFLFSFCLFLLLFFRQTQLIRYNGYPAEQYDVVTDDGYIINIQRIPHGRNGRFKDVSNKPVIFLQHGLLASSTNWITNLPNQSFGFVLADQGFDVWLGNVRGNTYGLHHVKLSVHSDAFWDFRYSSTNTILPNNPSNHMKVPVSNAQGAKEFSLV